MLGVQLEEPVQFEETSTNKKNGEETASSTEKMVDEGGEDRDFNGWDEGDDCWAELLSDGEDEEDQSVSYDPASIINRIRKLAITIRNSPQHRKKFAAVVAQYAPNSKAKGLILDVKTR